MSANDRALKTINRYHSAWSQWTENIFRGELNDDEIADRRAHAFRTLLDALRTVPTTPRGLAAYLRLIASLAPYAWDNGNEGDDPIFSVSENEDWRAAITGV